MRICWCVLLASQFLPKFIFVGCVVVLAAHESVVEDVAFHRHHKDLFGSVGDDKKVIVWDKRKKDNAPTHNVVRSTCYSQRGPPKHKEAQANPVMLPFLALINMLRTYVDGRWPTRRR